MFKLFLISIGAALAAGCATTADYQGRGDRAFGIASTPKAYQELSTITSSGKPDKQKAKDLKNHFCQGDKQRRPLNHKISAFLYGPDSGTSLAENAKSTQAATTMYLNLAKHMYNFSTAYAEGPMAPVTGPKDTQSVVVGSNEFPLVPTVYGFGISRRALSEYRKDKPKCLTLNGLGCGIGYFDDMSGASIMYLPQNNSFVIAPVSHVHDVDMKYQFDDDNRILLDRTASITRGIAEINLLFTNFSFINPDMKTNPIQDAIRYRKSLWSKYIDANTTVEESPNDEGTEINYKVSLNLNDFCKYGRSLADLVAQ